MRALRLLVPSALIAALCLSALVADAPAKVSRHGDPLRVKPTRHAKRRPSARTSVFATSWPCVPQSVDRAPVLSNAPQVKVILAYPTDRSPTAPDDYNTIQQDANAVRDHIKSESGNTLMVRFDRGAAGPSCDAASSDYLDIETVPLDQAASVYTSAPFKTVLAELRSKLHPALAHQKVNYVVYLKDIHPADPGIGGEAQRIQDTKHGYTNSVNQGVDGDGQLVAMIYGHGVAADFGFTDNSRRKTFLHEMSHTLGAVQDNAPHSTGAGHCTDGFDVMCYDDHGPNGADYLTTVCGTTAFTDLQLDCNKDDYFNASPAAGSYLDQNWNEADSVFLCPVADCDSSLASPAVSLTTGHPGGRLTLTATATGGPIAHYEWNVNGDGVYETDTGTSPTLQPVFSFPRSGTVEVRAVREDGTFAYASTPLSPTDPEPHLTVTGDLSVGGTVLLDGSGTLDPDGLVDKYLWDTDGDSTFETDTGRADSVTTSYSSSGTKTAGLEVDYSYGYAWTVIRFPIRAATDTAGTTPGIGGTGGAGGNLPPVAGPTVAISSLKLSRLLKVGVPLTITCGNVCVVSFRLVVDAKTAKKLHLTKRAKPVTLARVSGQFATGTARPLLRLSRASKRVLARAKSLKATLRGSIKQTGVNALTVLKPLAFKR